MTVLPFILSDTYTFLVMQLLLVSPLRGLTTLFVILSHMTFRVCHQ